MAQPTSPGIGLCIYCGDTATDREHVIPRSRGGTRTLPACRPCNSSKHARTPDEWIVAMLLARIAGQGNPRFPQIEGYLRSEQSPIKIDWDEVDRLMWEHLDRSIRQVCATWCTATGLSVGSFLRSCEAVLQGASV